MDICIVNATRPQKPAPNHCAVSSTLLPAERLATNTIATAASASTNASGNHFSNHSESARPMRASAELSSGCVAAVIRRPTIGTTRELGNSEKRSHRTLERAQTCTQCCGQPHALAATLHCTTHARSVAFLGDISGILDLARSFRSRRVGPHVDPG